MSTPQELQYKTSSILDLMTEVGKGGTFQFHSNANKKYKQIDSLHILSK